MMLQVNEKLEIKDFSGTAGLYSAVLPVDRSKVVLERIADLVGVWYDSDEFHCTLMYSPTTPSKLPVPVARTFTAKMSGLAIYGDEKKVLVVTLESAELQKEHSRLLGHGCKHTFDPYSPHVTLGKVPEGFDESAHADVNDAIKGGTLWFNNQQFSDLVP